MPPAVGSSSSTEAGTSALSFTEGLVSSRPLSTASKSNSHRSLDLNKVSLARHSRRRPHARQSDPQTSKSLLPSLVVPGFMQDGQELPQEGQFPSLTSVNNFINFCASTSNLPITNGLQITTGSCNPTPMGFIPSNSNMPSSKIIRPHHGDVLEAGAGFNITVVSRNMASSGMTNVQTNFLASPQQLDSSGQIIGHLHVVLQRLSSLRQTDPIPPKDFIFFRDYPINPESNVTTAAVDGGLGEGFYKVTVTPHAANHQPVLVPINQHGSLGDVIYFTVATDGKARRDHHDYDTATWYSFFTRKRRGGKQKAVLSRAPGDTSLDLLDSVIAGGFANSGMTNTAPGQTPSLTSTNNFINICATSNLPLTNGTQVNATSGSCNSAPMGLLPSIDHLPSLKIVAPLNGDVMAPNTGFIVSLTPSNFSEGRFTNSQQNYLAAPQQLDNDLVTGYKYVVIEPLDSFQQETPTDPRRFAFYRSINSISTLINVTFGLPEGFYRLSAGLLTANHAPVVLPVHQHGAVGDAIYLRVSNDTSSANQTISRTPTSTLPSATNSSSQSTTGSPKSKNVVGAAIGGTVAGIVALLLIVAGLLVWRRAQRRKREGAMAYGSVAVPFAPTPTAQASYGTNSYTPSGSSVMPFPLHKPSVVVMTAPGSSSRSQGVSRQHERRMSTQSEAPSYHTQA